MAVLIFSVIGPSQRPWQNLAVYNFLFTFSIDGDCISLTVLILSAYIFNLKDILAIYGDHKVMPTGEFDFYYRVCSKMHFFQLGAAGVDSCFP